MATNSQRRMHAAGCFTWNVKQGAACLFHVKHATCEDGKASLIPFHVKRRTTFGATGEDAPGEPGG
jgi:hypothetical protein